MAEKAKPVAVVLGVGPGLGASLARRFAQGYAVAISARSADYLRSLGDEIRGAGGQALEVPADMSDRAQVEAACKTIRERLGAPAILIYNAGAGPFGSLAEISAAAVRVFVAGQRVGRLCQREGSRAGHDRTR